MNTGHQTLESMSQAVWYNRWTLRKFEEFLKGDIIEIGCGIGTFTKHLRNYGQVVGIDIDHRNLKKAKKIPNVTVGFGDIEKAEYFFNRKKFDVVICLNVLEHIKDDKKSLKNIFKLLKPGGHLILLVPFHPVLYGVIDESIGHHRRYTKKGLRKNISSSGLKVKKIKIINFLGGVGWFVAGRIFKNKVVEQSKINVFNLIAPLILPIEELFEPPIGTSVLLIAQK